MGTAVADPPDQETAAGPAVRRRRYGIGFVVLAVAVGLLAGYAVGVVTLDSDSSPGDDSAEAGFARDMITHHDQAVTMGMIAYQDAATEEVQRLGYDIAMTQQGEIGTMHQWLREWDLSPTGSEPRMAWMAEDLDTDMVVADGLMPGMATSEQLTELREAEGTELDRLFLELMTYHHLGGIHMIDGVLDRSDNPDVVWLAELMRPAQQKEITVMQDLAAKLEG